MKIVVVRFSSLGDVVILSSLFETIYREIEGAEVTFITKGSYQPLYDSDPRLKDIITYPGKGIIDIVRIVREKKYDLMIDAHRSLRSFLIRKLVGGRWNLYENLRFERRVKVRRGDKSPLPPLYIRYNRTVANVVKNVDYKPTLCTKGEGEMILKKHDISGSPLILAPFASRRGKEWLPSNYAEVGRRAVKEGLKVLILGSLEERRRAEEIREMIGRGCYNFAGVFELDEIKEIMKVSFAVIGGDTGLLHIADALGVRCVFIYTSTHPSLGFAPVRETSMIISPELDCQPCDIHGALKCRIGDFRCLNAVSPDEVWRRVFS